MSDPTPITLFAQQCMDLIDAMNDPRKSFSEQQKAKEELSRMIRGGTDAQDRFDAKAAQAGERKS